MTIRLWATNRNVLVYQRLQQKKKQNKTIFNLDNNLLIIFTMKRLTGLRNV